MTWVEGPDQEAVGKWTGFVPSAENVRAITQVCRDYYEAWYAGDGARMEGCLHPDLAKRGVWRDPKDGVLKLDEDDARSMVTFTEEGRGRRPRDEQWLHIAVRDAHRHVASATVVAYPYVEYLHLVQLDDRWMIVNALWESRQDEVVEHSDASERA